VLLAAEGQPNNEIAVTLGTDPQTVGRWRSRFASERLAGVVRDARRTGRRRRTRDRVSAEILRLVTRSRQKRKTWSTRALAERLGVNHMLVYRVLREHGITLQVATTPAAPG
jgi:transposase